MKPNYKKHPFDEEGEKLNNAYMEGWDDRADVPMGVSQWEEHGKKYGYAWFWEMKIITKTITKCAELIHVHTEKEGGYCDTGADMDWSCRSDCVRLALERLRKYYLRVVKGFSEEKKQVEPTTNSNK